MGKLIPLILLFIFSFSVAVGQTDNYSQLSETLQKEGVAAGKFGDFELALKKFNELYKLVEAKFGKNSIRLASPLVNIGIQYKNLGDFDKAIDSYKKAESLFVINKSENNSLLGAVYVNLGNIYRETGDYNKALEYQKSASRILARDSIRLIHNYQDSKYNIAETQLKLGFTQEAIKFVQLNLPTIMPELKPLLYDLMASAYIKEGKFDLVERNYLEAIKSWIGLYGDNNIELASEYLAYSAYLMSQKNYAKALIYTEKAETIALKFYGKKSTMYAEVKANFGDYFYYKNSDAGQIDDFRRLRKQNLSEATRYYQEAIIALVDSFYSDDPFVDPPLVNVISDISLVDALKKKAMSLEQLAVIYLSEFDYDNAVRYYKAGLSSLSNAVQVIHRLQIGFENEDSKLFLSQNQESTFYAAINVAYKLYKQTKNSEYLERAFEMSEKGKASVLLASVKDMKAKEFCGIPDSLLAKEKYLKASIANYTSMLFDENHSVSPDSRKVNLYSGKIFKYNEDYTRLVESYEKLYPNYYALKYENKVVSINEIRSKLSSKQALVEFFVREPIPGQNDGELFRFVITKDSASFSKEIIDSRYLSNIQTVHNFLSGPNYLNTKKQDFVNYSLSAYALYATLLKRDSKKLAGKSIYIVPHNKLLYIPFDALISQMPDTTVMNFRDLKYLVCDYAIQYGYSATLLFDYADNFKRSSKNLLVFSPKYVPDEPRGGADGAEVNFFAPLPGAGDEVKGITKYIQAKPYVDVMAQEDVFKEKASDYDILHLAMHTIINDTLPMFSKLVFSRPDKNSREDGFLNTFEIYNMKLNARLAVLSACETGSGMLKKGEGTMSMARAFVYAGCPSIVMTLWQVEDKSGAKIMKNFYHYLSKGKRKDVALRMAKLKHLQEADPLMAHPHFWLGYVGIGNADELRTSKDVYFVVVVFSILILLYLDWYFRRRKGSS